MLIMRKFNPKYEKSPNELRCIFKSPKQKYLEICNNIIDCNESSDFKNSSELSPK